MGPNLVFRVRLADPPLHLRQILVLNEQILASDRQTDRRNKNILGLTKFGISTVNMDKKMNQWLFKKGSWSDSSTDIKNVRRKELPHEISKFDHVEHNLQ